MKARVAQMIGDANLRNFALISSTPCALLTFRLLSCVSMKLTETGGMLNSVFSETFSLIFWSSFKLLNSFKSFSGFLKFSKTEVKCVLKVFAAISGSTNGFPFSSLMNEV